MKRHGLAYPSGRSRPIVQMGSIALSSPWLTALPAALATPRFRAAPAETGATVAQARQRESFSVIDGNALSDLRACAPVLQRSLCNQVLHVAFNKSFDEPPSDWSQFYQHLAIVSSPDTAFLNVQQIQSARFAHEAHQERRIELGKLCDCPASPDGL